MAVDAAEGFGDFNRFVNNHGVGRFRHLAQLEGGGQQHGAFDGAEVFFVAVEQRADNLHQLAAFGLYAEENGGEELVVGLGKVFVFADIFGHFGIG